MKKKKFKMLLELVKKEETPMGAIGITESVNIMKAFGEMAETFNLDCYAKGYPASKLEYEPTGKSYEIKTIDDVAAMLSPEQFEFFVDDLRSYCTIRQNMTAIAKLTGAEIKTGEGMTWMDTGLNEAKTEVHIESTSKLNNS